ncbi:MAG: hypothetical protein KatS3mg077_0443 [Candidatus Binatia bacterium]|nr:MAG: hypothetical protein KatS3mg077_0443 [Candidatus Binatia bacterium]
MRLRTTIVLLLILAGLGAYLYWMELPRQQKEAEAKKLFQFKPEDVVELRLHFQDRNILLKKSGESWRLAEPIDAPADEITIKNLLNTIAECEVKRDLEDATDLKQFGLDPPFVTLTVKLKDRQLPEVAVGKNTPVGFSAYLQRLDDKKVRLTTSAFRAGLDKQVKDLRDKAILNFTDDDVQRFSLVRSDGTITLARKDGQWAIEQPGNFAADGPTVRSFLSTLRSMRAIDFPNDQPTDLSPYGLDNPRLRVVLFLGKDQAEKHVLIGRENPEKSTEIYVQTSGLPTIYTVSDWVWRDLNKNLNDFRDKTVLAYDADQVKAIEVTRADGSSFRVVASEQGQWKVEGQEGKPAESILRQWVQDIHDLRGYEIASDSPSDPAPYGLDKPMLTLRLVGPQQEELGVIRIGVVTTEQGSKEYFASGSRTPTVFKVRDYLVTRLNKSAQDFIEKPTPTPGGPTPTPGEDEATDEEDFDEEPLD